jgi:hypothetical protein
LVSLVVFLTSVSTYIYIYFFAILSSNIRCKCPNQLNLCAFMQFIMLCFINLSNYICPHMCDTWILRNTRVSSLHLSTEFWSRNMSTRGLRPLGAPHSTIILI